MSAMQRNVDLIAKMAATSSEKFKYVEKKYSYGNGYYTSHTSAGGFGRSYDYYDEYWRYDIGASGRKTVDGKANMSRVPDTAHVKHVNGNVAVGSAKHLVDARGKIYEWLEEYECAIELTGYSAYYTGNKKYKVYRNLATSFDVEVVTEEEALKRMENHTENYHCELHGYSVDSDYCFTCEKERSEHYNPCENETCEGKHDPYMCMECYKDSQSAYTWSDIKSDMPEDTVTYYMDMVWNEGNDYPQYTDPVPEWVVKLMKKETVKAG